MDQLLFSHGEDSHNLSSEHSISCPSQGYNEIEECEANFIEKMNSDEQWGSNDNYENQFMRINGPSVEFSQNFSQNSVNLSGRHFDDSRDYKNGKYLKILEEKKREEVEFNKALDQELSATQQELERKSLEISKLENQIRGFEIKIKRQDGEIERYESEIEELKEESNQLQDEKVGLLKNIENKDKIFESHRNESGKILHQLSEKIDQNSALKQEINSLHMEMGQLSENLAVFQEPDRNLLNFRGKYTHANTESPINSKNNDKELIDKLRMEKSSLDIELSSIRDKLEDRESRFRKMEEEHKKKLTLKEKKCKEVELKLAELKDEQIKIKTQNEIHLERLNNSLAAKSKELNAVSERLQDSDRRIKALLEDGKRKDERNKETTLELIEKGKLLH